MSAIDLVSLVIGVSFLGLLLWQLIHPERF